MPTRGYAAVAPSMRYLVMLNGQSIGADGDGSGDLITPTKVGFDYDLKAAVAPLAALKSEVSIISGLKIPWINSANETVPPGGRFWDFHTANVSPLISGTRSTSDGSPPTGPTSDQVVAGFLAGNTDFKTLPLCAQPKVYSGYQGLRGDIVYRRNASGSIESVAPQVSPDGVFRSLFGTPPEPDLKGQFDLKVRKSVLDLVKQRSQRLHSKLGGADRRRMEQHYDNVRDLERRVAAIDPNLNSTCGNTLTVGADPAEGGAYSNEDARLRAMCDLIHMAMACDKTRIATLQMTMFQSFMRVQTLLGRDVTLHDLGHGLSTVEVSQGIAWQVKHFAYLIQKFKDTPEGSGNMLDSLAAVYLWEGGHGWDPLGNTGNSSHSTENMCAMLAGRAGGLKPGQHVVAKDRHPASVLITAMKAVGYTQDTLGEVSGDIPQLRG